MKIYLLNTVLRTVNTKTELKFSLTVANIKANWEGVYRAFDETGEQYLGSTGDLLRRGVEHTYGTASQSTLIKKGLNISSWEGYSMPKSTKLERLMYEQYRIEQVGINNLINDKNALAFKNLAARKRYEVRIPKIIEKYNLPK